MKKFIIYLDKAFLHIFGTRSRWTHHNCSVFLGYLDQKRGIHGFGWSRHFRMWQDMRPNRSTGPKYRRLKMFLSVKVIIKTNKSSEMKILRTEEIFYNFYFYFLPLQEMSPQVRLSTAIVPFKLQCLPLCCSSKNSHSRRLSCFPPPQETEHDSHSPQSPQTPSTIKDKLSLCQGKTSLRYYVK